MSGSGRGLFSVLNEKFPGVADGLVTQHPVINDLESKVDEAIKTGDADKVNAAYEVFMPKNEVRRGTLCFCLAASEADSLAPQHRSISRRRRGS